MDIVQAISLGLVQGASEFVPISSSGHLVLVPWLLGWPQPGLVFDTVVHWGTLVAVLAYFGRDFVALASAWGRSLASRNPNRTWCSNRTAPRRSRGTGRFPGSWYPSTRR